MACTDGGPARRTGSPGTGWPGRGRAAAGVCARGRHVGGRAGSGAAAARWAAATGRHQRRYGLLTMTALYVIDHPLVQHKLTLLRRKEASTSSFRKLLTEISTLMAYEVL